MTGVAAQADSSQSGFLLRLHRHIDALELAPRIDHVVLFSGDGDFRPLVESLQRQGVRVSVVSTIRSQPPMIADELRRQADNFIELDALRDIIGRPPRETAPAQDA